MSAFPSRRYRVLAVETRTLETFVAAKSADKAKRQATDLWFKAGDKTFKVQECTFDVVLVGQGYR